MSHWTPSQQTAFVIAPKISGTISFFGCVYILWKVLASSRRRKRIHNRLLVVMSIYSLLHSIPTLIFDWILHVETSFIECLLFQNFELCGYAAAIYNAELAVYYLLVITYNFSEITMKKIEILMHIIPSLWTFIMVIVTNISVMNRKHLCGMDLSGVLIISLLLTTILLSISVGSVSMVLLHRSVRKKEKKNKRYFVASDSIAKKKKSDMVKKQVLLYLTAFYTSFAFTIVNQLFYLLKKEETFVIEILQRTLFLLQGALNVSVYMRPKLGKCLRRSSNDDNVLNVSRLSISPEIYMPLRRSALVNLFSSSTEKTRGSSHEDVIKHAYVPRQSTARSYELSMKQFRKSTKETPDSDVLALEKIERYTRILEKGESMSSLCSDIEANINGSIRNSKIGRNSSVLNKADVEFFTNMRNRSESDSDTMGMEKITSSDIKDIEITEMNNRDYDIQYTKKNTITTEIESENFDQLHKEALERSENSDINIFIENDLHDKHYLENNDEDNAKSIMEDLTNYGTENFDKAKSNGIKINQSRHLKEKEQNDDSSEKDINSSTRISNSDANFIVKDERRDSTNTIHVNDIYARNSLRNENSETLIKTSQHNDMDDSERIEDGDAKNIESDTAIENDIYARDSVTNENDKNIIRTPQHNDMNNFERTEDGGDSNATSNEHFDTKDIVDNEKNIKYSVESDAENDNDIYRRGSVKNENDENIIRTPQHNDMNDFKGIEDSNAKNSKRFNMKDIEDNEKYIKHSHETEIELDKGSDPLHDAKNENGVTFHDEVQKNLEMDSTEKSGYYSNSVDNAHHGVTNAIDLCQDDSSEEN